MLIVCPTCAMSYQIELAALGAAGRSVRCSQCKNTWFATPESVIADSAAEPAAAMASASSSAPSPGTDAFAEGLARDFKAEGLARDEGTPEDAAAGAIIIDAPPLVPHDETGEASSAPKFDPGEPENIENIETPAARRARHIYSDRQDKRTLLQRIASAPVLIAVLAAILLGALQWRVALVRQFPQTASLFALIGMPVNLRGLTFLDVKSRSEFVDGAMVLVVEGTIANLTPRTLDVPRLRFSLRNGAGHEVYAWTSVATKNVLGSGDGLAFRTRLASPPPDGRDVIVRFFSRRDAGLGS